MLTDNLTLKLSKDVIKRYENNLDDGILFLYNAITENFWLGNNSSNDVIKLIDGQNTLKKIYTELKLVFEGCEDREIKKSCDSIINELIDKNFFEVIK